MLPSKKKYKVKLQREKKRDNKAYKIEKET